MPFPINYRKNSPRAPVYDWFDFAAGVGYKTFYACVDADGGSPKYFLTPVAIPTANGYYKTTQGNGSTELNFDLEFKSPVVVQGDAIVHWVHAAAAGINTTISVIIYHVNGAAVETSIGTDTAGQHTGAGTWRDSIKVALTKTAFKIGEKLRLAVTITADGNSGYLYHDPESRETHVETTTGATVGGDLVLNMPFKVDI